MDQNPIPNGKINQSINLLIILIMCMHTHALKHEGKVTEQPPKATNMLPQEKEIFLQYTPAAENVKRTYNTILGSL